MNHVIFDFDGTLTKRDTLRPFASYIVRRNRCYHKLLILYAFLLLYKLRLVNDTSLKEVFLKMFIKGMSVIEVENIVKCFLKSELQPFINNMVFNKLRNHIMSGDKVYIASANFDFLLEPLIKEWNLRGIISTETERVDSYFTGKIIGSTCKGNNKVKKIKALYGDEKLKDAVAYGDMEDLCLLNSVGRGINVSVGGLSSFGQFLKRSFDIIASTVGLILTGWIILFAYMVATIDTRKSGIFTQTRIGQAGKPFKMIKIRTMRNILTVNTNVTTINDPRITTLGRFFRKTKIDELTQLINIFLGQMSFVGPRPDVPGFADKLDDDDKIILSVRPGITGPATLKYRHEEKLLASQPEPEVYNYEIIYPDKVRINRKYVENYTFWKDMKYICQTIFLWSDLTP